jgi:hypothetical protein
MVSVMDPYDHNLGFLDRFVQTNPNKNYVSLMSVGLS